MPPQLLKSQVDVVFGYLPVEVDMLVEGPVTIGAVVKGALIVELDERVRMVEVMLDVRL